MENENATISLNLEDKNTITEPLLIENKNKYVMFPIEYPDIYKMYKLAASVFWIPDEINFSQDLIDIQKLNENEKYFIMHILAFFAASDGIVMENLATRFSKEIPKPEVISFYAFQNAMEAIHSETYSLLIDTYVKEESKKNELFNAVNTFPAIKEKAEWTIKWINDYDSSFGTRLIAFAIVEGLFFSSSFCAIFWLRERKLLPGLSFANQLIARDESLHTDFACLLYSKLENKIDTSIVKKMFEDAVKIELKFITESIPCSMIGMNTHLMSEYVMFMADRLLNKLGYDKIYNKENPFQFMEMSASETKASFFEVKVSSYAKSVSFTAGQSVTPDKLSFNNDEDF
jgi:ribonucleotide reductase beta subunit family protein with ferritin-like domain